MIWPPRPVVDRKFNLRSVRLVQRLAIEFGLGKAIVDRKFNLRSVRLVQRLAIEFGLGKAISKLSGLPRPSAGIRRPSRRPIPLFWWRI